MIAALFRYLRTPLNLRAVRASSVTLCVFCTPALTAPSATAQLIDPAEQDALEKQAQPNVLNAQSGPPFRLKSTKIELGQIKPGGAKSTTFEIFNAASTPITLTRITSTCSCTAGVVDDDNMIVPPGGIKNIKVEIKNRPNPGPVTERVTIWYRDPATNRELNFGVEVTAEIAYIVKPDPFFVNLLTGESRAGVVSLQAMDGKPFNVLSVNGQPPVFKRVDAIENAVPGEASTHHKIAYDFTDISDDDAGLFLIIATDHPESPLVDLRIVSNLLLKQGAKFQRFKWNIAVDRIVLGAVSPGDSASRIVRFIGVDAAIDPVVEMEGADVTVAITDDRAVANGREIELTFTLSPDATGIVHDRLLVTVGEETRDIEFFVKAGG
jgi:hypothetical protein